MNAFAAVLFESFTEAVQTSYVPHPKTLCTTCVRPLGEHTAKEKAECGSEAARRVLYRDVRRA